MELKLENVCPCTAALFHAQPEDGTDLDTTKSYCNSKWHLKTVS